MARTTRKSKIINFREGLISYSILIVLILCALAVSVYSLILFFNSGNKEYSLLGIIASSIIGLLAGSIQITLLLKSRSEKRIIDRRTIIEKAFYFSYELNKYNRLINELCNASDDVYKNINTLLFFLIRNKFLKKYFSDIDGIICELIKLFKLLEEILYRRYYSGITVEKDFDKIIFKNVIAILGLLKSYYFLIKNRYFF